jgi:hypothetical protein
MVPPQASHCHAWHATRRPTRILRASARGRPYLGSTKVAGRRPAHVRAALRHRLRAEGSVAGRALFAAGVLTALWTAHIICPLDGVPVFDIYRYDTGIWGFIDSFRVVLVNGMRKWYASY